MNHVVIKSVVSFFLFLIITFQSNATIINQTLEDQGGGMWLSNFEIINDTLSIDIEEITLWFDHTLYSNITVVSAPTDWDPIAFQPDLFIPDDGLVDILALGDLLAPLETLSGLSVMFEWLGSSVRPDALEFEIYDAITFDVLDSGSTTLEITDVPEPSTIALFLFILLLIARHTITQKKGEQHV